MSVLLDEKLSIGVIGAGNMGGCILKGLNKAKVTSLYVWDKDEEKVNQAVNELGAIAPGCFTEFVKCSDVIIIAVKPNICEAVCNDLKGLVEDKLLISIAAGKEISFYESILGQVRFIRVMPNTPCMIAKGITLIAGNDTAEAGDMVIAKQIFNTMGETELVEEKMINKMIALTSSSPAYVFMFIDAMADAAVRAGVPRNLAIKLAAKAVEGSAALVHESGMHPAELKDMVCSPAGTTIEAVAKLEEKGMKAAVIEAMDACTKKAEDM